MSSPAIQLVDNPVRSLRTRLGYTLEGFAEEVGLHFQVLRYTEWGCYSVPSTKILDWVAEYGLNDSMLILDYMEFIKSRRRAFREAYKAGPWRLPQEGVEGAPIVAWGASLGLPRTKLSKEICVQPANLYRLAQGLAKTTPFQVKCALREIGFTEDQLEELDARQREWSFKLRR